MYVGATDAARAAADIVLTQPGLSTIVNGKLVNAHLHISFHMLYVCTYVCMYVSMNMFVCMYVCMYVCT